MNDFERKLRQQPFRPPPSDLRAAIFGEPDNVITPARWRWRDWFWPSPQAWGALAALWVVFAALSFRTDDPAAPVRSVAQQPSESITLLTFHHAHDLAHVLEFPN
jgi:hypothetical protein